MAQLNCPSCHHHGMVWDWNQSHLHTGGMAPAWGGLPTGTWHGSVMLPPYRPSEEMARRNSLRVQPPSRRSRRDLTTDDEDDSHHRRNTSPVRSRRGPVSDDSEDEVMSHRGSRRHRRRTSPASRNPSPALSRRSSRKKSSVGVEELIARRVKQNEEEALKNGRRYDDDTICRGSRRYDDETISNRGGRRYDEDAVSNRGRRCHEDETISNRGGRRYDEDRFSIKSGKRQDFEETLSNRGKRSDFDDSMSNKSQHFDDDVTSNRGGKRYDFDDNISIRGGCRDPKRRKHRPSPRQSPTVRRKYFRSTSSEDSGDEMSDSGVKCLVKKDQKDRNSVEEFVDKGVDIPSDVDKPLGPVPTEQWVCEHCTFVNQAGTRVCIVCCKTTNNPKCKQESKNHLNTIKEQSQEPQKDSISKQDASTTLTEEQKEKVWHKKENKGSKEPQSKFTKKPQTSRDNDTSDAKLAEKMNQLAMTPEADKKKGRKRRSISFWLGTKLYS